MSNQLRSSINERTTVHVIIKNINDMAPRDPDTSGNYNKNKITEEPLSADEFKTCLLHKKHKVVKLVEAQLQKIRDEGLVCCETGDNIADKMRFYAVEDSEVNPEHTDSQQNYIYKVLWFIGRLLLALLILLLVVWIAAGPLSNKSPHTPISLWDSFITTDNICTLEKKYLLRWSVSEYPD